MDDNNKTDRIRSFWRFIIFKIAIKTVFGFVTKRKLLLPLFFLINALCWSQNLDKTDSVRTTNLIDSLLIDHDLRNWSVRLFGNIKAQGFKLSNNEAAFTYIPNNLYGIGIGVASRKLILDIGFTIKDKSTENTDRFDLRGGFIFNQSVIDFYFQIYDGFNIQNSINNTTVFRDDIKSIAGGIDYLYLFNAGKYSQTLLRSGLKNQEQNIFSFGVGGFLVYNQISADSSVIPMEFDPYFNEQARITNIISYGIGAMGGLVGLFRLPSNFYIGIGAKAGIGLTIKNAETETVSYNPRNPVLYKLDGSVLFGYKWNRFYTNISLRGSIHMSNLGFENNGAFTFLSGKLVLGYRIKGNKKSI
ncbi:DUF4421 family protein [uncultured Eudoraea sp.]|uniref:DUF4421 family protein n=1 Tax=uncultured Eudoraea sp. TaxID=1035614 RepID=UPI0026220620|nr:DUF4421 family protein [uncultured Eudoraea sp.]